MLSFISKAIIIVSLAFSFNLSAALSGVSGAKPAVRGAPPAPNIKYRGSDYKYSHRALKIYAPPAGGYYWSRPYSGPYYYPRYLYYPYYNDYQRYGDPDPSDNLYFIW